ncbi:ribonuclease P protein subunit p25-like protein [Neosynchiropus ocellatus]
MENYVKSRVEEQPCACPLPGVLPDTPEVRVKDGSKIRNLMRFALSRMESKPNAASEPAPPEEGGVVKEGSPECPLCRQVVFRAVGKGVSKAITCAEIMKRRIKGLHQLTRLEFSTVKEVWEPLEPGAGLDSLTVSRNLPTIWILLSRDPLDRSQPGYQAPGHYDALWAQSACEGSAGSRQGQRRKRGGAASGVGAGGRGKGPGRLQGRPRDPKPSS